MSQAQLSRAGRIYWALLLLALVGLSVAPDTQGQTQIIDRAVALVDSRIITLSEVQGESRNKYLTYFFPNPSTNSLTAAANVGDVDALNRLIDYQLLLQAARDVGVKVNEAEIVGQVERLVEEEERLAGGRQAYLERLKEVGLDLATMKKAFRRKAEEKLLITRYISSQVSVNRQEVDSFRQERQAAGEPVEIYTLSHLLLACAPTDSAEKKADTLERAEALYRQLEGGRSFIELVGSFSEDLGSRATGGILGALSPNELDPVVLAEIGSLKIGQFSKPVQTSAGYHLFFLSYKQTARELLLAQRYQEKQTELLQRLRAKATIEIISRRRVALRHLHSES